MYETPLVFCFGDNPLSPGKQYYYSNSDLRRRPILVRFNHLVIRGAKFAVDKYIYFLGIMPRFSIIIKYTFMALKYHPLNLEVGINRSTYSKGRIFK